MSNNHTKYYRDIGSVEFVPSRRARRLNISIRHNQSVRVAVPHGVPIRTAYKFLTDHQDWVRKSLQRIHDEEQNQQPRFDNSFRTRSHQLVLQPQENEHFSFQISHDKIIFRFPVTFQPEEDRVQKMIFLAIIETYRFEAKQLLPGRVVQLADRFGFQFNRIFIKNLKSRWGSCSVKNNINLNLQLMRFDEMVIDYIILHELLHTQIKNHSRDYWQALEKICPSFRSTRKVLKSAKPYTL